MWQTEQFNLSLRLENKYEVKTLSVTTADTITQVLKNLLIRCDLSVSEDTLMMGPWPCKGGGKVMQPKYGVKILLLLPCIALPIP